MAHRYPSITSIAGMESAPRVHSNADLLWSMTKGGPSMLVADSELRSARVTS
jgi:hypothetical protein